MSVPTLEGSAKYRSPDELALLVKVHHNTVIRWLRDGVVFSDGRRRRPQSLRTPGGWRVREDHFFDWLEAVRVDRARPDDEFEPVVPEPARSQRIDRMNQQLREAGLLTQ
jgi:hypothetical protein